MKVPKQPPLSGGAGTFLRVVKIPYETGSLHFCCSRKFSADGTDWINEGPFEEYYPNGVLAAKGFYANGKKNGHWKRCYENGKPACEGYYRNDLENGHWKHYHENGLLAAEGDYLNGLKNGSWKHYHENGLLAAEETYQNGRKIRA